VCLIAPIGVHSGRILGGLGRVPAVALTGLLVLSLLLTATLSVSHALHQSLHHDSTAHSHFCLICCFAKGQVSPAPTTFISAVIVFCCLWGVHLAHSFPFPGFDYRTSPSRAPPLS
jgi:hypothetical protein